MADTQQPVDQQTQQPVEEQVTSKAPATKQKNPKRVAAGKANAEKTRIAREAQKKALIEAQSIIARSKPPVEATPVETKKVLTFTQWLSIFGIGISLVSLYYKREEIKKAFAKPQAQPQAQPQPGSSKIRQMD